MIQVGLAVATVAVWSLTLRLMRDRRIFSWPAWMRPVIVFDFPRGVAYFGDHRSHAIVKGIA